MVKMRSQGSYRLHNPASWTLVLKSPCGENQIFNASSLHFMCVCGVFNVLNHVQVHKLSISPLKL